MANLLKTGAAWLAGQMKAHAADDVSYVRGGSSISLRATIGRSLFQTDDGNGFPVNSQVRDYLITATDLVIDDVPATPAVGDVIVETDAAGVDHEYRVIKPNGEPAWRWSDEFRTVYRIHTEYVGNSLASPP